MRSTIARLSEIKARELADPELLEGAVTGFGFMMNAVLNQQVADSRNGVPLSNRVDVSRMTAPQKANLAESIHAIHGLIIATYGR